MALTQGLGETLAVAAALAVGALYSLPPARLKRFPVAAALCISGVRSLAVNLGVYWHFAHHIDASRVGAVRVRAPVQLRHRRPEGRARTSRATAASASGRSPFGSARSAVFRLGLGALALAYAGMAILGPVLLAGDVQPVVLSGGHIAALRCFGTGRGRPIRAITPAFTRFYMRVWALFFLEYVLMPLACITA